jgi:hypothetical protein
MPETSSPVYYTPGESERFFRKRHTSTIAFAVGLLLFLLPFVEIRCNNMPMAKNTGLGIVMGSEWKSSIYSGWEEQMKSLSSQAGTINKNKDLSYSPNIFLIVGLVAGVAGILVAFSNSKHRSIVSMCMGILAASMLIAMMVQLYLEFKSELKPGKTGGDDHLALNNPGLFLKLHFTTWYYLSLASFITAAFFGFKHQRIELDDAIRNAHQFEFQQQDAQVNNP